MTQTVLLGDICIKVTSGGTPSTKRDEYYNGNIPWLRTQEVDFGNIYSTEKTITEIGLKNSSAKLIPENSVIIAMYGATAGKSAINKIPLTTNQACCNLIIDPKKADYRYVYYHLLNNYENLLKSATGAAQQNLGAKQIAAMSIDLPNLETQRKIASILGMIDEKIELNRRINETLEQIGQTLFRHHFIDNPEAKNWVAGDVSGFADNIHESAKPPFSKALRYVALEHIEPRTLVLYNSTSADNATSNKTSFKEYDILFGKLRPYFHKVVVAPFDGVCSTDILAIRPKKEVYFGYTSFFMSQKSLIEYTTQASEGTRMPRTSWTNICNYSVAIPPNELMQKFNEQAKPLLDHMTAGAQQIKNLTTLRDILLPRLVSGKTKA